MYFYVAMEADLGLSRIVTLSRPDTGTLDRVIGSAVIARADRADLRRLDDLRGRTVAAVAPDAFGGYLIAARKLLRYGIALEEGDAYVKHVGLPMQGVVEAVRSGAADAGIVRTCLLESMVARGAVPEGELKVLGARPAGGMACLASTELYPDWPLAKARHTDLALAKAVATSLLSMAPTAEGLTWAVPADYQAVHEMYRS